MKPPSPSRPRFPRLSNAGNLTDMVRGRFEMSGGSDDRGGAGGQTPGPLPPAATARAQSRALAWSPGVRSARGAGRTRAWARAAGGSGQPGEDKGGRLTWRGQRAQDLAAAAIAAAAAAAAAARAGSDWHWLPGTGRWRPRVTHIRALRAGVGRGGDWPGAGRGGGARAAGGVPAGRRAWRSGPRASLKLPAPRPRQPARPDRSPHSRPRSSRSPPVPSSPRLATRLQPWAGLGVGNERGQVQAPALRVSPRVPGCEGV